MFRSLVDKIGLDSVVPVEYFGNKNYDFLPDKKLLQRFEVCDLFIFLILNISCYLNLCLTVCIALPLSLSSYIFSKEAFLDLFNCFFSIIHHYYGLIQILFVIKCANVMFDILTMLP